MTASWIRSVQGDFCEFCGYSESEFWVIMEKFYNKEIFEKNALGKWLLNHPVWEEV